MDFIANDGSYAHRGVWHVTDNLTKTEIPAKSERKFYSHGTDYLFESEATVEYRGDAICGQKNGMVVGGHHWGLWSTLPDGTRRCFNRAKRPEVVIGLDGYIPGPLCSRCAKKANIQF